MDWLILILLGVRFPEEGELIQGIRNRDERSLARLYDLYGSLVYRLILRITRNPSLSDDVLQETFARVWNEGGRIAADATQIGPWIFTIARNRALDYVRSPEQSRVAGSIGPELEAMLAGSDNPETLCITNEMQRRVVDALGKLDKRHRQVIDLAYYRGMSHSEIANELQQPLGTVKSWTRAALSTLRTALEAGEA